MKAFCQNKAKKDKGLDFLNWVFNELFNQIIQLIKLGLYYSMNNIKHI